MTLLLFHEDTGYSITSHKITKRSYISYMMSDKKNKDTLFSSTLKVGETYISYISYTMSDQNKLE